MLFRFHFIFYICIQTILASHIFAPPLPPQTIGELWHKRRPVTISSDAEDDDDKSTKTVDYDEDETHGPFATKNAENLDTCRICERRIKPDQKRYKGLKIHLQCNRAEGKVLRSLKKNKKKYAKYKAEKAQNPKSTPQ